MISYPKPGDKTKGWICAKATGASRRHGETALSRPRRLLSRPWPPLTSRVTIYGWST